MRIDSSTVGMESERSYSATATRITKVTVTQARQILAIGAGNLSDNQLQSNEEGTSQTKGKEEKGNYLNDVWEEMRTKLENYRTGNTGLEDMREARRTIDDIRQECLNYLMRLFFPDRHKLTEYSTDSQNGCEMESDTATTFTSKDLPVITAKNIGIYTFSREYYYEETENTTFTTKGTVKCADGREIEFNLNLNMSRNFKEYYAEKYLEVQASLTDPLVINLEGNVAELSDQTFFFDIDADGEEDEISRLGSGSGYLALDKNGDGKINDGSELFGAKSGNGFADLAAYDEDGNGFIDEGDSIFAKLKIWMMDENGKQQLVSLKEKGVGAICLQNASTDFSLNNANNQTKGMIRRTGFFLYENGAVGSIQHVDVARYNQAG